MSLTFYTASAWKKELPIFYLKKPIAFIFVKVFDLMDVERITIKSKELNRMGFKLDPTYAELFGHCKNCE